MSLFRYEHSSIITFDQLKVEKKFKNLAERLIWDAVKPGQEFYSPAYGKLSFVKIDKRNKKIIMKDGDKQTREFDLEGRISKNGYSMINYNSLPVYEKVSPPEKGKTCLIKGAAYWREIVRPKYACDLLNILKTANDEINSFYRRFLEPDSRRGEGKQVYYIGLDKDYNNSMKYIARPKSLFLKYEQLCLEFFQFESLSALVYFWDLYKDEIIHFYRSYFGIELESSSDFSELMNQMRKKNYS